MSRTDHESPDWGHAFLTAEDSSTIEFELILSDWTGSAPHDPGGVRGAQARRGR